MLSTMQKKKSSQYPLPLFFLIQQMTNWCYFSYFSQETRFDISCKLSPLETTCMKCQILFSGKNTINVLKCRLLKLLPRVRSDTVFDMFGKTSPGINPKSYHIHEAMLLKPLQISQTGCVISNPKYSDGSKCSQGRHV